MRRISRSACRRARGLLWRRRRSDRYKPIPPPPARRRRQARAAGDPGEDRGDDERADRRQRARQALADPRHPQGRERARDRRRSSSSPIPRTTSAYQLVEQRDRQPRGRGRRADHRQRRHRRATSTSRSASARRSSTTRASSPTTPTASTRRCTRRGIVPFGDDKQALSQRAVARDRSPLPRGGAGARLRQAGPVDADASTRTTPDFSAEPAEVYVEAPAQARVRQGAVGRAAQALLGEGAQGRRDARHVRRRVPAQHQLLRQQRGQRRSSSRGRTRSCRSRSASRPTTA